MKFPFKWLLTLVSFLIAVASAFAQTAVFDPSNDDTDLFLANPNIAAERPNVLIILDNTANWNTAFTNEKSALVSVVNGLTSSYNVGLMMFPETGGGNDSIDGGYVRFGVRQMTGTNKTALATIVGNLSQLGDKGNNATIGLALYEAYLYFGGRTAVAGFGKVKRDFGGNTSSNPLAASLPGNAFADAGTTVYTPAIGNNCQKNFIIYISNGPANENASARSQLQTYLTALKGGTAPTQISINPNGQQGNWADEMAYFMANSDVSSASGNQNVITYTVEVDPTTGNAGADMTALMKSMAGNGKGKYFAATSASGGTAIVNALNTIFSEIQSVNSVFAAASLPVSANVRGTNLNQVYVGVFRPDAQRLPRWNGNLKMYKFAIDSATNAVFLADANGVRAENQATGFIANTATSLWTSTSAFWSYRTPYESTDVGQASDGPDGDLVEKGGAAQRLRLKYALGEASSPIRNMYTCIPGGAYADCVPACVNGVCSTTASLLSASPFRTINTDLTPPLFNLNTQYVSPLTAATTQSITLLTDRLNITSLSNSALGASVAVSSLSNGSTPITVSTLVNNLPLATVNSYIPVKLANITGATYNGAGNPKTTTYTISGGHTFVANDALYVIGTSSFNGSKTVASVTGTTIVVNGSIGGNPSNETGLTTAKAMGTAVTATTSSAHGFTSGQNVTITSVDPTYGNSLIFGITAVTTTAPFTFTYTLSAPPQAVSTTGSAQSGTLTATATTSANHGYSNGDTVTISGAAQTQYNGSFVIANASGTSFTYTLPSLPSGVATGTIKASKAGTTLVTATATAHGFITGDVVTISGASPIGYNASYSVTRIDANTFQFTTATALANASGTITAAKTALVLTTATAVTSLPHGLATGGSFVIAGVTGTTGTDPATGYNTTWTVATVISPTSFTFSTAPKLFGPAGGTQTLAGGTARAWVSLTGHGYTTGGPTVTIAGVTPTGYNGAFAITKVDNDTFTYTLGAQQGTASGAATASIASTIARATAANHGFVTNDQVTISGATPVAFNGSNIVVTVVDTNTFIYTLGSPQLAATGTILAYSSTSTGGGRDNLINWVRGQDNVVDENLNGSTTDVRASIHSDVLHSRPLVVNYNRTGDDNDVVLFYGTNGGTIQAVRGGAPATPGLDPYGNELWSFVPTEFMPNLNRLRNNSPKVSSSYKRTYFGDGSFTAYTKDATGNGQLGGAGDIAYIYATFRRGGRMIYSFDVNDPTAPNYRWKIDQGSTYFSELGQTWSKPVLIPKINAETNPVLLFGGGYDAAVDDLDPLTVSSVSSTGNVSAGGVVVNRSMGRAIYLVDAISGRLVWMARGTTSTGTVATTASCTAGTTTTPAICEVPDMNYAFPADPTVIRNTSGGNPSRAYIGDTGGQMWRLDFGNTNKSLWTVTKLASIADQSIPSGRRKFLYAPDVVGQTGYDAILIGTGDREHPFDTSVANRMYMFKDKGTDAGPLTGTTVTDPTIIESALYNATPATSSASVDAVALASASGWYVTLGLGEKLTGGTIAVGGSTYFGTNQPDSAAGGGSCGANLGVARLYQISIENGTGTGNTTNHADGSYASRSTTVPGGGFLPPPAFGVPNIPNTNPDGSACSTCGSTPRSIICFGVKCIEPGAISLGSRIRRYWYKDISE